jgi:hypothetical protein
MFNEPVYGEQILLVKVIEDSLGSFPNSFYSTYKCLVCSVKVSGQLDLNPSEDNLYYGGPIQEGLPVTIQDGLEDRAIMVCNFRRNKPLKNTYYLAFLVGKYYVLDNQSAFLENL